MPTLVCEPIHTLESPTRLEHALRWKSKSLKIQETLISNKEKRRMSFLTEIMKLYIVYVIAVYRGQEIHCEICHSYKKLDLHHGKYWPEKIKIEDIKIFCSKCHRNTELTLSNSELKTVFINGKRYCETSHYKFEY